MAILNITAIKKNASTHFPRFTEIPNNCFNIADKLWDMNVGSSIEHSDYTFSIRGKSPYHNTNHGKQMYGN